MADVQDGGGAAALTPPAADGPDAKSAPTERTAQSNTAGGVQPQNGNPPSTSPTEAQSSRHSTPADVAMEGHDAAETTNGRSASPDAALQPQAGDQSASEQSHESGKRSKGTAAAPYGTRSRNRPGTSRINYAEDVEMEFEMAQAPSSTHNSSEPPARGAEAIERVHPPPQAGSKKGSKAGQSDAAWGHAKPNSKDEASSTSTPTANQHASTAPAKSTAAPAPAPAQPTKRRKNAAGHATNGVHASAPAPSQPGTRRATSSAAAAIGSSMRESNMMTFERTGARLVDGALLADDGQTVSVNDQVYLVCEPPGEPYYLCRVMEFIHVDNDPAKRIESMRVNWFYRPRDVQRYNNDTRLVYATMHSDLCPITSLRGKCRILHRSEVDDLDDFRKSKDSFWFNQVFDRFIHRWYDVIPTSTVINVPEKVKRALDERWKYICLETSRVKELTSAVKSCKRCVGFCATNDSVECAVCHNTYHMNCVRPPLLKKPSRGFAWACGPCSRAQEKKLEARRTPLVGSGAEEPDEEEVVDEEEEEADGESSTESNDDVLVDLHPATQAEIALAKMWPMRYLGIHCRVEDALQYDDRAIYPRASSRLGPRHQANVNVWHGRPVELVKPAEIKKRYIKTTSHKKDAKLSKETVAAIEADKAEKAKRPKWVMDEPPGYVRRGEDFANKDSRCTAELMFKMPPLGVHSTRGEDDGPSITPQQLDSYMDRAKSLARSHVGVNPWSTNFLDKCLALLAKHQYDPDVALKHVKKIDKRKDLKEPELTKEEEKKWNEGVANYGSEIRSVRIHASKTMTYGDAVRYYYTWKKTPKGREIWGSYSNRKGKSRKSEADTKSRLLDDVADDQDDSAFDNDKAVQRKRTFQCKFCTTRHSRLWRRAPGVSAGQTVPADGRSTKEKGLDHMLALCQRCASLWRKYAVKWENTDEIARKVAQGGGKAWKRRIDEELLREVYAASSDTGTPDTFSDHADMPAAATPGSAEPPKKKPKLNGNNAGEGGALVPAPEPKKKEKEKPPPPPKAPTPPPVPAPPRLRTLPCAVCRLVEGPRLECAACRMNVHKSCYGIEGGRQTNKWYCDTCKNDKKESVSYSYECVLCPQRYGELDLYEPPKISHKKKTDREREKERMEKELVEQARQEYRIKQQDKGRPVQPREPLKRTADNNWVHVYCALWHAEIKYSSATRLDMVEGIGAPTLRYDAICKLCNTNRGACVVCLQCHANVHVGCAHAAGYTMGFDITPVKATRRDAVPTVTLNGDTGTMMAAVWCKEHSPKTIVHAINEVVEGSDMTALQLFAREFKQADLTLTGTARKANLVDQSTRIMPQAATVPQGNRRTSTVPGQTPTSARGRPSNAGPLGKDDEPTSAAPVKTDRTCARCKIDASPRWWEIKDAVQAPQLPRIVDGPLQGVNQMGNGVPEHAATEESMHVNPYAPRPLQVNTEVSTERSKSYLCQKCHWKQINAPEELNDDHLSGTIAGPEPQPTPPSLPLRSPPAAQPFGPIQPPSAQPQPPATSWAPPQQSHPLPAPVPPPTAWHTGSHAPPGPVVHPPPHIPLHNGIGLPSSGPIGPPPFYPPYNAAPQSNGYASYPPAPVHASLPPASSLRGPPPPPSATNGGPPPLQLGNGSAIMNGLHSPRMPYSPTRPYTHGSSRPSDSPFTGPQQQMPYATMHHTSPATGRPATPRDVPMRDAPPVTAAPPPPPPTERVSTGASASPSLRNLLH